MCIFIIWLFVKKKKIPVRLFKYDDIWNNDRLLEYYV